MSRGSIPAALTAVAALALLLAYGTPPGSIALFSAFLAGFVVLPGAVAFSALDHGGGGVLRTVAFGSALGYVLCVLAFILTAELGLRPAFLAYPVIVIAVAAVVIRRRGPSPGRDDAPPDLPPRLGWALAAVLIGGMSYLGISLFTETPLPGEGPVNYFRDFSWHIALAADAKHNWPIEDPHAAGAPIPYHHYVHVQMAAASQVTGIELPEIFMRLSPLALVALLVLQLAEAGRSLLRSPWAGLIAAGLILGVGGLRMNPAPEPLEAFPFLDASFALLYLSPSQLFGIVIFLPLVTLIGERIAAGGRESWGAWLILVTVLGVGAGNAKVAILPVILAALALLAVFARLGGRRIAPTVLGAGAALGAVVAAYYLLLYSGHSSNLKLDPLALISQMPAVINMKAYLADAVPAVVLTAASVPIGIAGLFGAQLIGILWLLRDRPRPLPLVWAWLLAFPVVALATLLLVGSIGPANQLYIVLTGAIPGMLLAAEGLRAAWLSRPDLGPAGRRLAALGLGAIVVLAAIIAAPGALDLFGASGAGKRDLFWYGGLALLLVAVYLLAPRPPGWGEWAGAALCTGLIVVVGALATPTRTLIPAIRSGAQSLAGVTQVTPELYRAMVWLRDNGSTDAVLAVNNGNLDRFEYSAFSERRAFIEGWRYLQVGRDAAEFAPAALAELPLIAERLELNRRALAEADPAALAILREQFGVRYLVNDQVNGFPVSRKALLARLDRVYAAPGVEIYALR